MAIGVEEGEEKGESLRRSGKWEGWQARRKAKMRGRERERGKGANWRRGGLRGGRERENFIKATLTIEGGGLGELGLGELGLGEMG